MPEDYLLTLDVRPTYLYAKGEGPRSPENALRFFRETHEACMRTGRLDVLLEMCFSGPPFDASTIFSVVSQRAPDGARLRRIAYVESSAVQAPKAKLAETVAVNRGVNVRLFPDVASAERWLLEP